MEPVVPTINLPDNLKAVLEKDFEQVTKKKKLHILPSELTVVQVLEDFVRSYAKTCVVQCEKQLARGGLFYKKDLKDDMLAKVTDSVNIAKEVADGLRVTFDFSLKTSLLYRKQGEADQHASLMRNGHSAVLSRPRLNDEVRSQIDSNKLHCFHV